jgi:hypothetical protein
VRRGGGAAGLASALRRILRLRGCAAPRRTGCDPLRRTGVARLPSMRLVLQGFDGGYEFVD